MRKRTARKTSPYEKYAWLDWVLFIIIIIIVAKKC